MTNDKYKELLKSIPATLNMQLTNIQRYLYLNKDTNGFGKACVMIGSGFSKNADREVDSSMKDWIELGKVFYEKLYNKEPTDKDMVNNSPIKLASMVEASFGRAVLDKIIQDSLPDDRVYPNTLYRDLLNLPWHDVFTTNYDRLLEKSWTVDGMNRHYNLVTNKETLIYTPSPRIIKLHGSFPNIHPYIITEEDYRKYPQNYPEFVNTVRQALIENLFCLIGFSSEDPNFLSWIGWLRDVMGRLSMPVYLITYAPNIHDAQVHLLKSRNIEVVNLASIPLLGNFRDAFDFFFTFLKDDESNQEEWKCALHYLLDNDEHAIETIKKAAGIRKSYKGWLVLPQKYYEYFHEECDTIEVGKYVKSCKDENIKLNLLYEFDWRLHISNTPRDFSWFIECLEDLDIHQDNDEFDIVQKKVWLKVSLLKFYRHKSSIDKYKDLFKKMETIINDMPQSIINRYYNELCLFHLERLEYNEALKILEKWEVTRFDFRNRILRDTVLAEIGKQSEAVSDLEDIRKQIKIQRLSSNFAKSPLMDSCMQQVYNLLHFMEFGFYNRVELKEKNNTINSIIGIDPFEKELQKGSKKLFEQTHSFNINIHTNTWNFGRNGFSKDFLYSYRILDWMEESGYPFGNTSIGLNQELMSMTISKLMKYEPEFCLRALVRSCFGKVADNVLTRDAISKIGFEIVDRIFELYLPIIVMSKEGSNETLKAHVLQCINLLVRLCIKTASKNVEKLFSLIVQLISNNEYFNKDDFWTVYNNLSLESVERLAEYLFEIPYKGESNYWMSLPFLPKGNYDFSDELLKHLISGLENDDKSIRNQAYYRIAHIYDALSEDFKSRLRPYIYDWRNDQEKQNHYMRESYHYFPYNENEKIDIKFVLESEIDNLDIKEYKVQGSSGNISKLNGCINMLSPIIDMVDDSHKDLLLSKIADFLDQNEEALRKSNVNELFGGLHGFASTLLKNIEVLLLNAKIEKCDKKIMTSLADVVKRYVGYEYNCIFILTLLYEQLDRMGEIKDLINEHLFKGDTEEAADTLSSLVRAMAIDYDHDLMGRIIGYIEFSQSEDVPAYISFIQQLVADKIFPNDSYSLLAKMLLELYNRLKSSENAALASDVEYETLILINMLMKEYHIPKDDKAIATWMAFNDDRNTFNDVRLRI